MEEKSASDSPGKNGLLAGAEVIKYITALSTGAIVFSAGLLSDKVFIPTLAKWFVFGAWCLLALSVLAGLLAAMRIPIQLAEQNYNVEDKYLKYPGMIQQISFFFGILSLGVALTFILVEHGRRPQDNTIPQATQTSSKLPPNGAQSDKRAILGSGEGLVEQPQKPNAETNRNIQSNTSNTNSNSDSR